MFKTLFLYPDYSFDLKGNCKVNGLDVINNSNKLVINVNGYYKTFDKIWLGLLSHYEVNLPFKDILKISFIESKSKVIGIKCGFLMVFKRPIVLENGFRIIPGFTRFAVNELGIVKSVKSGKILKPSINSYGYPYVNVYDPDKNKWRSVTIHLLIARAFIANKDPVNLLFVNHKDGNKLNYCLSNLEWVSSSHNNQHAVCNSLRSDNNPCRIKDVFTNQIKHYPSLSVGLSALGLKSNKYHVSKKVNGEIVPRLILNRYEIKLNTDFSDWFYTKENIHIYKNQNRGPFQAKDLQSGVIIEAATINELSLRTNVSSDKIQYALKQLKVKKVDGYLFRNNVINDWPVDYEDIVFHKPKSILVTNIETGEEITFNSLRKTVAYLGGDKRTLKNRLIDQKPYDGWILKEINTNSP